MNKLGKILIIEDNKGDQLLYTEAFEKLQFLNEIMFFDDGESILEYLNTNPNENSFFYNF